MDYGNREESNARMNKEKTTVPHTYAYVTGFDKSRLGRTHQIDSFSTTNR